MPGPDTAVEEAPVLLGFALALLSLLMYFVLRGVRGIWQYTFGAFFLLLAAFKIPLPRLPDIHPFGVLAKWNADILNALELAAQTYDSAAGFWFHESARLQGWMADEIWKGIRDTFHFDHWLVKTWIPTYVHGLTDVLHGATSTLTKTVTRVERVTVHVTKIIRVEAKSAANQAVHTAAKAVPIALAPPLAIPRLWHGIDELRAKWSTITKRLGRVEALLGAAAMAVAMANVLGVSARCLRSGNIGKTARRLCGLDTALLEGLLGGLIVLEGGFSVRELAQGLLDVEDELVAGISLLVTELNDLAA